MLSAIVKSYEVIRFGWIGMASVTVLAVFACGGATVIDDGPIVATPSPAATETAIPEPTRTALVPNPEVTPSPVPTVSNAVEVQPTPQAPPTSTATPMPADTLAPKATSVPTAEPAPVTTLSIEPGTVARYLVQEQLASLDLPNDAIGETTAVSGSIAFRPDGLVIPELSGIEVDLQSLKSDSEKRDKYLRGKSLESNLFPTTLFLPNEVTGFAWPMVPGEDYTFEMVGDMTVRDVTRAITWTVQASFDGERVVGKANTRFTFGDFQMNVPSVFVVISVEDDIRLELHFVASVSSASP